MTATTACTAPTTTDTLDGGAGADVLDGGEGRDRADYAAAAATSR